MSQIHRIKPLLLALALAVVLPAAASAKSRGTTWYVYSIPFTCGEALAEDVAAIPGRYATAITITNKSRLDTSVRAHVQVTVPASATSDDVTRPIAGSNAVTLDCQTIAEAFVIPVPIDASAYVQGSLILETRGQYLDVQVQNTAGNADGVTALTFREIDAKRMTRPRSWGNDAKDEICHVPPGNPRRAHTIEVGTSSVSAHLGHGDYRGECDDDDDDDDEDDD